VGEWCVAGADSHAFVVRMSTSGTALLAGGVAFVVMIVGRRLLSVEQRWIMDGGREGGRERERETIVY